MKSFLVVKEGEKSNGLLVRVNRENSQKGRVTGQEPEERKRTAKEGGEVNAWDGKLYRLDAA